jgi:archaellin
LKKIFVVFVFILLHTVFQTSAQVYTVRNATVSFFSESPLENIDATNSNVQSILNTDKKQIAVIIPITGFQFKKDLMREHFNEKYMESDKFSNATYSGIINEDVDFSKDGSYDVTSTGKMKMHGVEKEVTHHGKFIVSGNDISLSSEFNLALKDYDIQIPKLLFQNIADTINVKLNINFQPYKK